MAPLVKLISTSLGIGYIPFVPATWASAAAAVFIWFFPQALWVCVPVFFVLGLWACKPAQSVFQNKDPQQFVMDEVCGMMISLAWVPRTAWMFVAAFFLFRLFDVWKPGPIRLLQNSTHASSIMTDDLLAGLFANLSLQLVLFFWRPQ